MTLQLPPVVEAHQSTQWGVAYHGNPGIPFDSLAGADLAAQRMRALGMAPDARVVSRQRWEYIGEWTAATL